MPKKFVCGIFIILITCNNCMCLLIYSTLFHNNFIQVFFKFISFVFGSIVAHGFIAFQLESLGLL
jgi:hypothetical protein